MKKKSLILAMALGLFTTACNVQEVPPAHKGMEFKQSSVGSSEGFGVTKVLEPGSHSLDLLSELYVVQCSEGTAKEELHSTTKDGVDFGSDIYIRFHANCDDPNSVDWILRNVDPNPGLKPVAQEGAQPDTPAEPQRTVTAYQLYHTYVHSILGNVLRDSISKYAATDVNDNREAIGKDLTEKFHARLDQVFKDKAQVVIVPQIELSKLHIPEELLELSKKRASQSLEADIARDEQNKVSMQIETEKKKQELALAKSKTDTAEIEVLGTALRRNPEYLSYLALKQAPSMAANFGKGVSTLIVGEVPDFMRMMMAPKESK